MSLILDALTRAERERRSSEQGVPDLLAPPPSRRQRRRLPWLAAAGVCVLGAGAALWWSTRDAAPPEAAAPASREPPAVRATRPAVPEQAPAVTTPSPPAARAAAGADARAAIEALYAQRVESPAPATAAGEPVVSAAAPSPPAGADAGDLALPADAAAARQEMPADVERQETPVDLEQVLREVRRASADDALSEHPVPVLGELSKQFRDRVPTLMYLRHDYAGDGDSSVLLNGATLRRGQRTGPVQVIDILPDSVILRFDGTDFRLRALNSWVNL